MSLSEIAEAVKTLEQTTGYNYLSRGVTVYDAFNANRRCKDLLEVLSEFKGGRKIYDAGLVELGERIRGE